MDKKTLSETDIRTKFISHGALHQLGGTRQLAGGQRGQIQLESEHVHVDVHGLGQARVDLADPADGHAIAEHRHFPLGFFNQNSVNFAV